MNRVAEFLLYGCNKKVHNIAVIFVDATEPGLI